MGVHGRLHHPLGEHDVRILNEVIDELDVGIADGSIRKSEDNQGITTKKLRFHDLGEVDVGTSETTLRHNLGVVPHFIVVTPRSGVIIYESTEPDKSRVYLTSVTSSGTARVIVFG